MSSNQGISSKDNKLELFNLDSKSLREIFRDRGEQIIKWENNNSSKIYLQENFEDLMLSKVKEGDVNEEEVIDFINDRKCSL